MKHIPINPRILVIENFFKGINHGTATGFWKPYAGKTAGISLVSARMAIGERTHLSYYVQPLGTGRNDNDNVVTCSYGKVNCFQNGRHVSAYDLVILICRLSIRW